MEEYSKNIYENQSELKIVDPHKHRNSKQYEDNYQKNRNYCYSNVFQENDEDLFSSNKIDINPNKFFRLDTSRNRNSILGESKINHRSFFNDKTHNPKEKLDSFKSRSTNPSISNSGFKPNEYKFTSSSLKDYDGNNNSNKYLYDLLTQTASLCIENAKLDEQINQFYNKIVYYSKQLESSTVCAINPN